MKKIEFIGYIENDVIERIEDEARQNGDYEEINKCFSWFSNQMFEYRYGSTGSCDQNFFKFKANLIKKVSEVVYVCIRDNFECKRK